MENLIQIGVLTMLIEIIAFAVGLPSFVKVVEVLFESC